MEPLPVKNTKKHPRGCPWEPNPFLRSHRPMCANRYSTDTMSWAAGLATDSPVKNSPSSSRPMSIETPERTVRCWSARILARAPILANCRAQCTSSRGSGNTSFLQSLCLVGSRKERQSNPNCRPAMAASLL